MAFKRPHIVSVPSGQVFLEQLAGSLVDDFCDSEPEALASVTILLPTRRATRRLKEAFLRSSNSTTLLLPRIYAIGDIEEEDPIAHGSESVSYTHLTLPTKRIV